MENYIFIIALCVIIIISYFYNFLLQRYKISSVLLLIATGVCLKLFFSVFNIHIDIPDHILEITGTIGLIIIVLEAALDLKVTRRNRKKILKAIASTLLIILFSIVGTTFIIQFFSHAPIMNALIYSIPVSIVSSAIVIPSISNLPKRKREYLIYESIFSDIFGILIFNFLIVSNITDYHSFINFSLSLIFVVMISIILSVPLVYCAGKIKSQNRHVFILSILILLYSVAELFGLSALVLILVFGLVFNNIEAFLGKRIIGKQFNFIEIRNEIKEFKVLLQEFSFLIRTIFFVIFGYSIQIDVLLKSNVIIVGTLILIATYLLRAINLAYFVRMKLYPEIFIAPRGLITILLFYSIPSKFLIQGFERGVIFYLIVVTSIVMTIGLAFYKDKNSIKIKEEYFA